jgi:hypothetical protein
MKVVSKYDIFINVAKNKHNTNTDTLTFKPVTPTFVDKQINKLNIKKQLVSMAFLQK